MFRFFILREVCVLGSALRLSPEEPGVWNSSFLRMAGRKGRGAPKSFETSDNL